MREKSATIPQSSDPHEWPSILYRLRQNYALENQPTIDNLVENLRASIQEPPSHPYGHNQAFPPGYRRGANLTYKRLLRQSAFRNGALAADRSIWKSLVAEQRDGFLYRVASLDQIQTWLGGPFLAARPPDEGDVFFEPVQVRRPNAAFVELQAATRSDWLPLKEHLAGLMRGSRSGTWWGTVWPAAEHEVVERVYWHALRSGLCDVKPRLVLLRLDLAQLQLFSGYREARRADVGFLNPRDWNEERMYQEFDRDIAQIKLAEATTGEDVISTPPLLPLELDAFAYPVFHAQAISGSVGSGWSIDLTGFPELARGCEEFIIHNVPVSCVSLRAGPYGLASDSPDMDLGNFGNMITDRTIEFWEALWRYLQLKDD